MSNRFQVKRTGGWRLTWGRFLAIAMAAAIAVNIAQFSQIEAETRHNYQAFHLYETANLFETAISRDDSSRRWVAPFYYLGELFPGSVIIIPTEGINSWFPFEESVLTFGRAAEIQRVDYDPVTFIDLSELEEYRIETSSFAPEGDRTIRIVTERVAYFVDGAPSGRLLVMTPEGTPGRTNSIAFIDVSLLEDAALQRLGLS